jgi:hypothetical protein
MYSKLPSYTEIYEYQRFEKIVRKHVDTKDAVRHLAYRKSSMSLFMYNSRDKNSFLVGVLEDIHYDHVLKLSNDYGMSLITE